MPPSLTIDIQFESVLWKPHICCKKSFIRKVLFQTLKIMGKYNADISLEVSFLLTTDLAIQQLNHSYRNKQKPTNVLAFPLYSSQELKQFSKLPSLTLGDIVLAYETIVNEAKAQQKTFSDHCTHLIVHGWLHLWGYDHQNDKQANEMEQLEIAILSELAISNPYESMI